MTRCPHGEFVSLGETSVPASEVIRVIQPLLTVERRTRIEAVLEQRTYSITPVLEGLYDRGNASAVLRSAESMGYQSVHIVDSSENFKQANRVTQGAEKWLDLMVLPTTHETLVRLRSLQYRILVTAFGNSRPIDEVDFSTPTAIVFGNERDGVSEEMLAAADERVHIPMAGFSQSFNISVAAALVLYHARQDRIRRLGQFGDLTEGERIGLRAHYYLRSVANPERLQAALLSQGG